MRLARLAALLAHRLVTVRRIEYAFFHPKTVVLEPADTGAEAVVGSFNLTGAGLRTNIELGIAADPEIAADVAARVEAWWEAAEPYDLAALIEQRLTLHPVELVYLRMLAHRFGAELDTATSRLGLRWFQELGVAKAQAVLERRGGVIVGDEVGLGKTYIAGELIDRAQRAGVGPILVLCPAHLKRSVWIPKTDEWNLKVEVLSYQQMLARAQKTVRARAAFRQYAMIVCDEAHYLRNRRTATSQHFEMLLAAQHRRPRTVLLTATPVCNKGSELARLMQLAAPALASENGASPRWSGLPHRRLSASKIRTRCAAPTRLTPAELRELHEEINDLMVRRTRQYVRDACHEGIGRPAFPVVDSLPVIYELDREGRGLFAAVLDAAAPAESGDPEFEATMRVLRGAPPRLPLTLAAYAPDSFSFDPARIPPWVEFLIALLRSMLLKRIESSPAALAATARHMADRTRAALADLERGEVAVGICDKRRKELIETVRRFMDAGEEHSEAGYGQELDAVLTVLLDGRAHTGPKGGVPKAVYRPASLYRIDALRHALEHDAATLEDLAARAERARCTDPKFAALLDLLDGLEGKAVLFSSSRVTTADLTERLERHLAERPRHRYHGRLASLGREQPASTRELARTLGHFCPLTAAPVPAGLGQAVPEDLYDLVITTDVLAEGVNLQQAGILINYDLPWCPTRLEQRLGRLDRIGSPHALIAAHTFLPDQVLDVWLRLMDTLMKKTKIAATLVGVATALLPDAPVNIVNFTTLTEQITKPAAARVPPPLVEMQRAWLHQARSHPELKARIEQLTPWAGAIHPQPCQDPMVVYCFTVTASDGGGLPAFARVYAGERRGGNVSTDTERCLRELEIDPAEWIEAPSRHGERATARRPASIEHLELVEALLERARAAVAEAHEVPGPEERDRIRLLAWILRPGPAHRAGFNDRPDQRPHAGSCP